MKKQITLTKIIIALSAILVASCQVTPSRNMTGASRISRVPKDFLSHTFDTRKWIVAYQAGNNRQLISEWMVQGDQLKDWEEFLTIYIAFDAIGVKKVADVFTASMKKQCPNLSIRRVKKSENDITIYWEHNGCGKYKAQKEIKRIVQGRDGIYTMSYAVKKRSYSAQHYQTWKNIIMKMKLQPRG